MLRCKYNAVEVYRLPSLDGVFDELQGLHDAETCTSWQRAAQHGDFLELN